MNRSLSSPKGSHGSEGLSTVDFQIGGPSAIAKALTMLNVIH